jgi:ribosomal protein L24
VSSFIIDQKVEILHGANAGKQGNIKAIIERSIAVEINGVLYSYTPDEIVAVPRSFTLAEALEQARANGAQRGDTISIDTSLLTDAPVPEPSTIIERRFPAVGDKVAILRGPRSGKQGVVEQIEEGNEIPLWVAVNGYAAIENLAPHEVAVLTPNPIDEFPVSAWRIAVMAGETYLGYTVWADEQWRVANS